MDLRAIGGMTAGAALTTAAILHADASKPEGWKHQRASVTDPMFLPMIGGTVVAAASLVVGLASKNARVTSAAVAAGTTGAMVGAGSILAGSAIYGFVD